MAKLPALALLFSTLLFSCDSGATATGLVEVDNFGDNPGNLQCFRYTPENLPAEAPLVVVLHGCAQDAGEAARLSGWNELADTYGFVVLYPQQKRTNNIQNCFNWFVPEDVSRETGEVLSIKQMVSHTLQEMDIHEDSIFVTGISAGGAMAAAMLAVYPDLFRAGAVMAGIPYGAADGLSSGFAAMKGEVVLTAEEWEERVRKQNQDFTGTYPALVVFHGVDDPIVNIINATELSKQWVSLYDLERTEPVEESPFEGNERVKRTAFPDSTGRAVIVQYSMSELGHAIAVDPGIGEKQGGAEGQFAKDIDFFSSYWAGRFFGVVD